MPNTLRKSIVEFRVDRYYGYDANPKVKAENQINYYDTVMDRINIILKPKVTKINLKPSHKDFPTKSQVSASN